MGLDSANVRRKITGAVYVGLTSATAPTATSSSTSGYDDLGYIDADGITESTSRTTEPTRAWQNADTVREDVTE